MVKYFVVHYTMRMISLGHVNIRTSDLQRSVAFYRDVIGLTPGPAATRPDSNDHRWMHDNAQRPCIHLQTGGGSDEQASAGAGVHHVAFNCEDPAAWRQKLRTQGVAFTEAEFAAAGLLQFNLTDPDGVRLELLFDRPA